MKASLKARPARGVRASFVAMILIPLALFLAGCSGTMQTRSVTQDDTYYHWKPQMETLPIEVHGGIQQLGSDDMAKLIPYGTTPRQYAATTDGQGKLATRPRIVLYVGTDQNPARETYCDAFPVVQPATTGDAAVHMVAALCDGPRLVDLTARDVQSVSIQNQGMVSIMKSMKRRLLFGLNMNEEVEPAEYGNG
ncbi:hypothetical protein [Dyella psychrodurans]|uniref:Uncharacterized protein n=1 Tax=Dyella psychrodurans TaxID=1927960 RepID=A0A370XEA7_9GAMM|nr:hypothetical protein [Dyella psychrodurans]RDS86699.1 hypothetical protein DWU99_05570 [Dyella psychrodurans]